MGETPLEQFVNETLHAAIRAGIIAAGPTNDTMAMTEQPAAWQTWVIGLAFVTLCSFSAPLGIMILPCLANWLYARLMSFLVALGIGTLSGSCFFILIPHAFGLTEYEIKDGLDFSTKSCIVLAALYAFLAIDRCMQYALAIRRRRVQRRVRAASPKRPPPRRQETVETIVTDEDGNIVYSSNDMENSERTRATVYAETHTDSPESADNLGTPGNNTLTVPASGKKDDDEVSSISVKVMNKRIVDPENLEITSIAYIIIIGSSMNNFLDGMSMGSAFSDSLVRGVSIGIASFSQQFPQEVGTLAILANSGLGIRRTLFINLIPAFLSYLGFAIGVWLDGVNESYDTYVFSVSAGMYLYVFLGTLIPEVRDSTEELIKTNMRESLLVTFLQCLGMGGGATFMYFMAKLNKDVGQY